MAIEQTSAISALTQVTNRDPQDPTAPLREKKVSAAESVKESTFSPSELKRSYCNLKPVISTVKKLNELNRPLKMVHCK